MSKNRELPEVKSLMWLSNMVPYKAPPEDLEDRICNAVHVCCDAGARKIVELADRVDELEKIIFERDIR